MPPRPGPICAFEDGAAPAPCGAWHGPGYRWLVLPRHGRRPLAVLGRTLLRGDTRCAGLPWWSAVTIHETRAARFAVALRHVMSAAAGDDWQDAMLCDSAEAARADLLAHDPAQAMPAPAPGDADRFAAQWAGLLGALFGARRAGPA